MQNDYLDLFAEEGEEAREGFGGGVVGKEVCSLLSFCCHSE